MDATAFLNLWHTDRAMARRQALALGPRIIGLSVALSARFGATDPRGSYGYWLRAVRCPELSADLRAAGWRWNADGDLVSERLRIVVRQDGNAATAAAEAITEVLRATPSKQQASRTKPRQGREFAAQMAVQRCLDL